MKKITILVALLLLSQLFASNEKVNNLVSEGWELLKTNNYQQAISKFDDALVIDPSNSSAHISKLYYYQIMNMKEKSFNQFMDLLNNNDDKLNEVIQYRGLALKSDNYKLLIKMYKKILKKDELNFTNRLIIMQNLASCYSITGNLRKTKKTIEKMHPIHDWNLIGPFENILGAGFDEVYEPEKSFDEYKTIEGKNDIPLNWFKNTHNPNYAWVDMKGVFSFNDAIYYANNFVYSPEEREVIIHFGVSGMTTLFLNDEIIASDIEEERNCLMDQFVIKTKLNKGWNRFLIKIGNSEISNCNFFLNIVNSNYEFMDDIKISIEAQQYTQNPKIFAQIKKNKHIEELKEKIENNPNNLLNYIRLSTIYENFDKIDLVEKYLEEAEKIAPNCSIVKSKLLNIYNFNDKEEEARMMIEKLFKEDVRIPSPIYYQISKELGNENYDLVKELLGKLEYITGKTARWYIESVKLFSSLEQVQKALDLLDQGFELYPNNYTLLDWKINQYQKKEQNRKAFGVFKKYLKNHYSQENLFTMAILSLQKQDIESFYSYRDKQFELNPASSGIRYAYANFMYSQFNDYQEAMNILDEAIQINPTDSYQYKLYGDSFRALHGITKFSELSNYNKAILKKYYLNSLKYEPLNYSVRKQLRELNGQKSIFSLFDEFNYEDIMSEKINLEKYPEKHSVIVKKSENVIVHENGGSESENYFFIKILKESGCEEFQEMQFYESYYEEKIIEEAKVIKSDGAEIEGEIASGTVVFKKLDPNDYIYIKLKTKSYLSGKFKNHFFKSFSFNSTIPVIDCKFSLIIPKGKDFDYLTKNFYMEPVKTDVGTFNKFVWSISDTKPIEIEYAMPDFDFVKKKIELSSIDNWAFIVDWYLNLTEKRSKSSSNIKKKVAELFADKDNLTSLEKVKLVYEFITKEINYSYVPFRQSRHIPQKAKRVLSTRLGDCKDVTCLSISMLKEMGIDAYYVLLNTENKTPEIDYLPSFSVFNHVITAVDIGDSLFYMDLSAQDFPFGTLPVMDIDSFSLLVKKGESKPFNLEAKSTYATELNYVSDITIDVENNSTNKVNIEWSGLNAGYVRSSYKELSQKDRIKNIKESLAGDAIDVSIIDLEFKNLDNSEPKVFESYTYSNQDNFINTGSFKMLKPDWLVNYSSSSALSYENREHPIEAWSEPGAHLECLNIFVEDASLELMELPDDVIIDSKYGYYTQTFRHQKDKIVASKKIIVRQRWVSPTEYLEFKEFFNKMVIADKRQLLFKSN